MNKPVITHYAATEQMERKENQDFFFADPKSLLYLVADGMGGYEGGAFASRFASHLTGEMVKLLGAITDPDPEDTMLSDEERHFTDDYTALLHSIVRMVNKELNDEGKRLAYKGMGTTLVFIFFRKNNAYILNLGDSPCYRYSEGSLVQITRSHSKVDDMVREGVISKEEAMDHPESNIVRIWLGGKKDGAWADINIIPIYKNDRFLLCTDGVSKMLTDKKIESFLKLKKPKEAIDGILDAVKNAPHKHRSHGKTVLKDNATAMIVDVVGIPEKDVEKGFSRNVQGDDTILP
ncbi:MAG: protein phosphatase 2C domain-containing protein [Pseudomonadota bacterium]